MLSDKQRHVINLRRSEFPKALTGLQSEKVRRRTLPQQEESTGNVKSPDLSFRENQQVASTLPNRFACMLSDKQRHVIHLRRSELPKVLTGLQSEKVRRRTLPQQGESTGNVKSPDLSFRENQQVASTLPNRFACMLSIDIMVTNIRKWV